MKIGLSSWHQCAGELSSSTSSIRFTYKDFVLSSITTSHRNSRAVSDQYQHSFIFSELFVKGMGKTIIYDCIPFRVKMIDDNSSDTSADKGVMPRFFI